MISRIEYIYLKYYLNTNQPYKILYIKYVIIKTIS